MSLPEASIPSPAASSGELIYEAAARGITIFVTTHYMDEAEYCNRVSIMVDGKIEALDSPSALKRDFKTTNMNQVFHALARKSNERRINDETIHILC